MSPENAAETDWGQCVVRALRTGELRHLQPVIGTVDDYIAQLKANGVVSGVAPSTVAAQKQAVDWAEEQAPMAGDNLRKVREFGAHLGIDWSNAEIRQVGRSMIFEVRWRQHTLSVVVDTTGIIGRGTWLSGRSWIATTLLPSELDRLRHWCPGLDRDEDRAIGQILVQRSGEEILLARFGLYDPQQLYNAEVKSIRMSVQLPVSFDKSHPDTIKVLGDVGGIDGTLTEIGNDELRFGGEARLRYLEDIRFPMTIAMKERDSARRESWSATVDGRVQVFSRMKDTMRIFYSPMIMLRQLGERRPSGGVTLTLTDHVVTDFRLGSNTKAAQPDHATERRPERPDR